MPGGRPTKLTLERKEALLNLLELGHAIESSCLAVGIHPTTFRNWMRRGQREEVGEFQEFFSDTCMAFAKAAVVLVGIISEAAETDWRAAAWLLERRYPEKWADCGRVEDTVGRYLESLLNRLEENLAPDAYEQVLQVLAGNCDLMAMGKD